MPCPGVPPVDKHCLVGFSGYPISRISNISVSPVPLFEAQGEIDVDMFGTVVRR